MSDKFFIKQFKVNDGDFDSNGNLNPNADLMPLYGTHHVTVDKFGKLRDTIYPGSGAYRKIIDTDTDKEYIGKDEKHAASGLGYVKPDSPGLISTDEEGLFGMPDDNRLITDKFGSKDNPLYTTAIHKAKNTKDGKIEYLDEEYNIYDFIKALYKEANVEKNALNAKNGGKKATILMLAPEDAVVSPEDIIDNGFDGWRDDDIYYPGVHEVQVRKATPIQALDNNVLEKYKYYFDIGDAKRFFDSGKTISDYIGDIYKENIGYEPTISYETDALNPLRVYRNQLLREKSPTNRKLILDKASPYWSDLRDFIKHNGVINWKNLMDKVFPFSGNTISDRQQKNCLKCISNDISALYKQNNILKGIKEIGQ